MRSSREKGRGIAYSITKLIPDFHIAGAKNAVVYDLVGLLLVLGAEQVQRQLWSCVMDAVKQALTMIVTCLNPYFFCICVYS